MPEPRVMLITGARKGIGRYLAEYYLNKGFVVAGCSRGATELEAESYTHFCLDVADEKAVKAMMAAIRKTHGGLDVLVNNAGVAAMNHSLLTPMAQVERVLSTNVVGAFLLCREAARLLRRSAAGRIVNFTTVAVPMRLAGEAIYAASKSAVESLTRILASEFADYGITVNAVGPTPIRTDLTRSVPEEKLETLLQRQALRRFGEMRDVSQVIDFFIDPASDFITGQTLYLGGVS